MRALILFLLLPPIVIGCAEKPKDNMIKQNKHIQVIGHRGASGLAPENTLVSFKKALEFGVDYVELDVHLTKDDSVIVIHDATVDRTTNGKGKVRDLTLEQLKKLDAGSKFNKDFVGEKLPLLTEVLQAVNGKSKVMIEIKKGDDYYPGIEKKVLDIIKSNHGEKWCEMHTFHDKVLENWLVIDKTIPIYKLLVGQVGPLYYDDGFKWGSVVDKWKGKGVTGISPKENFASSSFIDKIHKAGMITYIWTVNDETAMKELIEKGADGIISNFPDKALRLTK